jgi:hypothetical protein
MGLDLRRLLPAVAWLGACCCVAPSLAQGPADPAPAAPACGADERVRFRGGGLRVENDRAAGTDRNYTNGVSLVLVSHDIAGRMRPECLPAAARLHASLIKFVNPGFWSDEGNPRYSQNIVFTLGQAMYTPNDFAARELVPGDRPYAGLLYASLAWNRRRQGPRIETLDTREIALGVIGPASFAEESQHLVHDLIGVDRFEGWRHQLRNEPALRLAIERKYRPHRGHGGVIPGFSAESIRSAGLRLGNIETSAVLAIEGRAGWNLPNDFGSYPIRAGADNRAPSTGPGPGVAGPQPAGAHLFAMAETRLVAYDFSLDGNLFRSSHSVSRRPWVGQAAAGVAVHGAIAGHAVKLAIMRVYRTREFDQQSSGHSFASLALSVDL